MCCQSNEKSEIDDSLTKVKSTTSQIDVNQKNLEDSLKSARSLVESGQWRGAEEEFDKVLTIDSSHREAIRSLAIVKFKLKEFHQALRLFDRADQTVALKDFDYNFYRGETNRMLSRFAQAAASYESALKIKPKDPMVLKSLAWTYFRLNSFKESLAVVNRAIEYHPNDVQMGLIKVRIFLKLGRLQEVTETVKDLKAKAPSDQIPFILSVEGDAYLAQNDCDRASGSYKLALKKEPLLAGALLGLGKCSIKKGEVKEGTDFVESAVRIQPKLVEAYYILGQIYEKSDSKKSKSYYKAFYERSASDPHFVNQRKEARDRVKFANSSD